MGNATHTDVIALRGGGSPARRPSGMSREGRNLEKKIKEDAYLDALGVQRDAHLDALEAEGDRFVASAVITGVVAIAQEEEWAAEQVRTQRAQARIEAVADAHAIVGAWRVQRRGQRR